MPGISPPHFPCPPRRPPRPFDGWEGEEHRIWRIEDGAFVADSLAVKQPRNEFLAPTPHFEHFEVRRARPGPTGAP